MKELSIEEKAKRYDELKVTAQELEHDGCFDKITLFDLFPELKESEDEKIRKAIYNCVNWFGFDSCYFKDVTQEECLAWLERQGEQNLANSAKTCKDEQKPVEWSEEDRIKCNGAIHLLENLIKEGYFDRGSDDVQVASDLKFACKGLINWLKSLKDRVQPKPQNKWKESLATADLENSLCDIQDGFSDTSYEYRILGEAIEFIRCTESKPQWKPSDEQMEALKGVQEGVFRLDILESLYNDLLKLKE